MALDVANSTPSKSLDFGADGYTGSVSTWHELLQLTCPDPECGVVFVRGEFPDNPDSILARAQRHNEKGTIGLGLRIPDGAKWAFEPTAAQGLVNLRWPCTRFNCVQSSELLGSDVFASCTICSFVKDGTTYQIMRVMPSRLTTSSPSVDTQAPGRNWEPKTAEVVLGGVMRFGCCRSAAYRTGAHSRRAPVPEPFYDKYVVRTAGAEGPGGYMVACESTIHEKRLEMRLWIDRFVLLFLF